MIYLDNASTSWPKPDSVYTAMDDFARNHAGNPGPTGHRMSRASAEKVDSCRRAIAELLNAERFPVYKTGRGGRYPYHGPGQRVAYAMLDLKKRGNDIRRYVYDLELWLIQTLAEFSVIGERREDRIGIWVRQGIPSNSSYSEDKIAAIGVRVKKWVAFHGIALNIDPNLDHFEGIVPCGVADHGITSLWNLGITVTTPEVDSALKINFENVFERKTTETVIV